VAYEHRPSHDDVTVTITRLAAGERPAPPETWPVFIAYRDATGLEHAKWLFKHLKCRPVPTTISVGSESPRIAPFWDKDASSTPDFRRNNQPALERASAFILVCSYGVDQRESPRRGPDWLYREIDWWVRKRKTCPILIRTSSKDPYIPQEIQRKWPLASWVELDLEKLEALSGAERDEEGKHIVDRILRSIADSRVRVVDEDLQRLKRLAFRLLVTTVTAGVFALVSFVMALMAYNATKAALVAEAREHGQRLEAETNFRIAESRRLAAQSDLVRPSEFDVAALLALEASRTDTTEANACLKSCIEYRPEISRYLDVHEGNVVRVAYGGCGIIAVVYAGAQEGNSGVVLLDANGKRVREDPIKVDGGTVKSVAFGPDSTIVVGYSLPKWSGGGLLMLDSKGALRRDPIKVHEGGVAELAVGSGGTIAAEWYASPEVLGVKLFDAKGRPLRAAPVGVEGASIKGVAIGPEETVAIGYSSPSGDGVALLYAKDEYSQAKRINVKEGGVTSIAFGPNDTIAVGCSRTLDSGHVVLLDTKTLQQRGRPIEVGSGYVGSVAMRSDGGIAAGYWGAGGGVVLLDATGNRLWTVPTGVKEGHAISVVFGPGGTIMAGFNRGPGGGVVMIDENGERILAHVKGTGREATSVAFDRDGTVAVGYRRDTDGGVALLDLTGRDRGTRRVANGPVYPVAFGPGGMVAAGYEHGSSRGVARFNADGTPIPAEPIEGGLEKLMCVTIDPGGNVSAGYSNDSGFGVAVFNAKGKRPRTDLIKVQEGQVTHLTFGPGGTIAAAYSRSVVNSYEGGVILFGANGERLWKTPIEHIKGSVRSVALSAEGALAVGYEGEDIGGILLVAPNADGSSATTIEVKKGAVINVAFGPGATVGAAWSRSDSTGVLLFDAHGKTIGSHSMEHKHRIVKGVAFGPGGALAAVFNDIGSDSFDVVLLDLDPKSWRRKLAHLANRNLTPEEWARYFRGAAYRRTIGSLPWPHDLKGKELKDAQDWEREHPEEKSAL
jgi:WD40 repeat protein